MPKGKEDIGSKDASATPDVNTVLDKLSSEERKVLLKAVRTHIGGKGEDRKGKPQMVSFEGYNESVEKMIHEKIEKVNDTLDLMNISFGSTVKVDPGILSPIFFILSKEYRYIVLDLSDHDRDLRNKAFELSDIIFTFVTGTRNPGQVYEMFDSNLKEGQKVYYAVNEYYTGSIRGFDGGLILEKLNIDMDRGYYSSLLALKDNEAISNYKQAITQIERGSIESIDVGKIGDKYFFGVAGFALDAIIGAKFDTFNYRGPLPYFYLGLQEFFKYHYEEFELSFDDQKIIANPLILTIANTSQYGNNARIAPQANYKDGMLDICIIDKLKFFDASFRLNYLFNGKIQSLSAYRSFRTNKLHIKRENNAGYYHLDGEVFDSCVEFEIEILARSLKVCL